MYYNEELVTYSKFQTQLSRKLQRFRACRANKKCSIFHELSEYNKNEQLLFRTGPLGPPLIRLDVDMRRDGISFYG